MTCRAAPTAEASPSWHRKATRPSVLAAAAVVFVGTVNGCGSGSFMYLASATGTLPMDGRLIIVEGSGTGDLEGISGKATSTLTISPSQTYQGKIRCQRG